MATCLESSNCQESWLPGHRVTQVIWLQDGTATQVIRTPGVTGVSHWKLGLLPGHSMACVLVSPTPPEPWFRVWEVDRTLMSTARGCGEEHEMKGLYRAHSAQSLCSVNSCGARKPGSCSRGCSCPAWADGGDSLGGSWAGFPWERVVFGLGVA